MQSFGFPEDEGMGSDSSEDEETIIKRQMKNMELSLDKIIKPPVVAPKIEEPEKVTKQPRFAMFDKRAYKFEPSSAVFEKELQKIQ